MTLNNIYNSQYIAEIATILSLINMFILFVLWTVKTLCYPKVIVLKKGDTRHINEFIDLYTDTIDPDYRIPSDLITIYLDQSVGQSRNLVDMIYVCTYKNTVCGYLKIVYSNDYKILFIPYMGIDRYEQKARNKAVTLMLNKLTKVIEKRFIDCNSVVFEIEKPKHLDTKNIVSQKIARIRHFTKLSKKLDRFLYKIDIDYIQPSMPTETEDEHPEEKCLLMYIPLKTSTKMNHLNKKEVMQVISFLYKKVYQFQKELASHDVDIYCKYIDKLINKYEKNLHQKVNLIEFIK